MNFPSLPLFPILAGTGHRPDAIGSREKAVRGVIRDILNHYKPSYVISGMALGFDTWLAEETLNLGFRLYAAVPFIGQDSRWPRASREPYRSLLTRATVVTTLQRTAPFNHKQAAEWMQDRNAWMVDNCQGVIACYNGDPTGGTANCVRYARIRHKPMIEFNPYELEQG